MTVSKTDSATDDTGATIQAPATLKEGQMMVLYDRARNSGGLPTYVLPTDFTEIDTADNGNTVRVVTSCKIATAADEASPPLITGMNGTGANRKMLVVFGDDAGDITAFNIGGTALEAIAGTGNAAAQVNASGGGTVPLVVCMGMTSANASFETRSMSPTEDGEITLGAGPDSAFLWKVYNASPANVTCDLGNSGANPVLWSAWIELTVGGAAIVGTGNGQAGRQNTFRAMHGGAGCSYNEDLIAGCKANEPSITGLTADEVLFQWLGLKGMTAPDLTGRMNEFAIAKGCANWQSMGGFTV